MNRWLWLGTLLLTGTAWLGTAWGLNRYSCRRLTWLVGETLMAVAANGLAWWMQRRWAVAFGPPRVWVWLAVLFVLNLAIARGCQHRTESRSLREISGKSLLPDRCESDPRLSPQRVSDPKVNEPTQSDDALQSEEIRHSASRNSCPLPKFVLQAVVVATIGWLWGGAMGLYDSK